MPVIDRLQQRFAIGRVCIVADRGMISAETLAQLEARSAQALLHPRHPRAVRPAGARHRAQRSGVVTRRRHKIDYGAQAVTLGERRYIVYRNEEEAKRDAAERQAILDSLARQLQRGDKALVGNTGYRRFLKTEGSGHFAIDHAKAEAEARFDGVFVLHTNAGLDPLQTMLRYKQLWTVEAAFRTAKHLFATRPIYHKLDETNPRPRLLLVPCALAEECARRPHRRARRARIMACHPRGSRLADRDRNRARRRSLPLALHPSARRQSRLPRRRHRYAAHDTAAQPLIITPLSCHAPNSAPIPIPNQLETFCHWG
jgi:hypothetical protein